MKKVILTFTIICLFIDTTNAQVPDWLWAKSTQFGGLTSSVSLVVDANGNTYMTGDFVGDSITFDTITLKNNGVSDIFLAKYDTIGKVLWAKGAGGTGQDIASNIAVDAFGKVYILGYYKNSSLVFDSITLTNAGGNDIFLAKYDSNGEVIWAKSAGGTYDDFAYSISANTSGSIYVVGEFKSKTINFGTTTLNNNGISDVFFVKYSEDGNILWAKSAGGFDIDYALSVASDVIGNVYLAGGFRSQSLIFDSITLTNMTMGYDDIFAAKFDNNGNVIWAKSAGGSGYEFANAITLNASGNAYVTGQFNSSTISFGSKTLTNTGYDDIFLTAYDSNGNILWAKSASGNNNDEAHSIDLDASGNVYVAGYSMSSIISFGSATLTNTNSGNDKLFLSKYDANGNPIWVKSDDETGVAEAFSVKVDASGRVYIAGTFWSSSIVFGQTTLTNTYGSDIFYAKLTNNSITNILNNSLQNISVYPNPVKDKLIVENPQKSKIEILNLEGVITKAIDLYDGENIIEMQNLASGVYILRVIEDKEIMTMKFIKQ